MGTVGRYRCVVYVDARCIFALTVAKCTLIHIRSL